VVQKIMEPVRSAHLGGSDSLMVGQSLAMRSVWVSILTQINGKTGALIAASKCLMPCTSVNRVPGSREVERFGEGGLVVA
jgi:hypothetical protein